MSTNFQIIFSYWFNFWICYLTVPLMSELLDCQYKLKRKKKPENEENTKLYRLAKRPRKRERVNIVTVYLFYLSSIVKYPRLVLFFFIIQNQFLGTILKRLGSAASDRK